MSLLMFIVIVLAGWCALSVTVAGLFSLVMRGLSDEPAPPRTSPPRP